MRAMRRILVVAALGLAACGSKKDGTAAAPTAAAPRDGAPAAGADAAAVAKPAAISKEARAAYRQHLRAGRKLAKAKQWSAAIAELDAALAAIPGDDRALGELSWAAFSAGDYERARKAGHDSVLAATDAKLKAASLYNLGRIEEANGKIADAVARYRESLALRPNKIVAKRLADLEKLAPAVAADAEPSPCSKPMPEDKLCPCLLATVDPDLLGEREPSCELSDAGAAGFQVARYSSGDRGEDEVALAAEGPTGWFVVDDVEHVYNPGAFGISEEWELAGTKEESIGGKQIVRFTAQKSRSDSDMGIDEVESEDTTSLIVCVRGDAKTPTTCPLDVITSYRYERDRLGVIDDEDMTDVADLRTKDLPIIDETKVSVEIGPTGIAKIRAITGTPRSQLGDLKLW